MYILGFKVSKLSAGIGSTCSSVSPSSFSAVSLFGSYLRIILDIFSPAVYYYTVTLR